MEGDGDGVQVFVESSWNVLQGSLDSCVTVVFLDPHTHDPIISTSPCASEKLVLVPPTEPVPCEITVKFQGRLCHVQSFYTLSTARICELYSQSKLETDPDYICTVKGWIPYVDSCFSEEGNEMISEAADVTHMNGMQETDFIEGSICESVMSSVYSPTVALNPAVDVDLPKSVYSSGDDSWVDLKSNGSFTAENACVSLSAPELDNWHVPLNEDELAHLDDQLVLVSKAKDTGVKDDSELDGCCEDKVQFKEHIVQCNAQQDMFEAELELVDHSPWAAITIRLLSLQDKSLVEVDQMVFLAVSGPVPEPASPCQSAEKGANSLYAMFLPSMLQMARSVSGNSDSLLKCENSSQPCEQAQDKMDKLAADENLSQSCELAEDTMDKLPTGREEIGVASLQNAVSEDISVQQDSRDLAAHVHNNAAFAASKAGSLLNLGGGDQGVSQQSDSNGAESKRTVEIGEQPFQSDSDVMPRCNCKKLAGGLMANDLALTLEAFSERFDRLESLCLRMESYLQRTFENLDQRIMHLEVQHRKGSEETDCVSASPKQSGMSVEASVMQSPHNNQEPPPSSMQYTALSDLSPRSVCKEGVSIALTQSAEQGYSELQDVLREVPNPTLFDVVNSDFAAAESLVNKAPSESQELSRGPATMVGSMGIENKRPFASLDDAWASALSAFASSFTPVVEVEAENTVTNLVDGQPSGSSCDAPISMSQECEIPRKGRKTTSDSDVNFVTEFTNDTDSEAVNSEDGPIYEDCGQAHFDEQMPTAHALPVGISPEKLDILLPSHLSNVSSSVPNDSFNFKDCGQAHFDEQMPTAHSLPIGISPEKLDILLPSHSSNMSSSVPNDSFGLKEMQSMLSKARTGVNHSLEDIDVASMQGFPSLTQDAQAACPQFDVFASDHSNSLLLGEPKDNSPALRGFKTALSPVFDSTSAEMLDVNVVNLDANFFNEETKIRPHNNSLLFNDFSQCQEIRDLFHLQGFRSISSSFGASKALQTEENEEELFCNTRASLTFDFLGISMVQGKLPDMCEVQDPESLNSTSFTYCEADEATIFPDILEEDCSNYQDGGACSEDSLCFSQDFDTCQNDLCDDEWSCAPNIFYLNDPEFTDDETNIAATDVDEKIEMSDISDTDSTEDLPFWPALHNARIEEEQPITVFPGFENLS